MDENSPPPIIVGEELYVELGNGSTTQPSQLMDVFQNLQQDFTYLRNKNECLLEASEEHEMMIRE